MNVNKMIKDKEAEIVTWWNNTYNGKIKAVSDEFSTYDFEGDNVIVELKHRFKAYDTKMIETFFYIVIDEKGLSLFNINNNINKIITLKECNKLMEHTHYWSKDKPKIMKLHRNLPESLSVIWEKTI